MEPDKLPILILAAGASRRMRGRDKLMELVAGEALLARVIRVAQASGAPVLVALPPGGGPRCDLVARTGARMVRIADCAEGMAASIRGGVASLPAAADGVVLMLADMPEISTADLRSLLDAYEGGADAPILRAAGPAGEPGHPILFPARFFAALCALRGDRGARDVLAAVPDQVRLIPLTGRQALVDLDRPEDWQEWRGRTGL